MTSFQPLCKGADIQKQTSSFGRKQILPATIFNPKEVPECFQIKGQMWITEHTPQATGRFEPGFSGARSYRSQLSPQGLQGHASFYRNGPESRKETPGPTSAPGCLFAVSTQGTGLSGHSRLALGFALTWGWGRTGAWEPDPVTV